MLAHDTKDTLLSKLPDLPPLAAQILGTLSGYSSQLPDLAALAKSESKTSLGVLVESARLFPKQPPKEFESAAQAIGPRGLRRGTLRGVLPSLFDDKEPDGGIDQEMLWWQAHIRAGAAERIAELAESSHLAAAYPAAFLADVGRLGLEACGVDGASFYDVRLM